MIFLTVAFATISTASSATDSHFDKKLKLVVCEELLPEFTLSETSEPTDIEVQKLCSCIWNTFPNDGWEQKTARQIRNGEDPGWRMTALISRFGNALENCGGYEL